MTFHPHALNALLYEPILICNVEERVACRFRFFIDGKFAADGFTSYNQLALSVTLNVTSANHTLQIAKVTEAAKGEAILQSMELSTGGR